MSKWEKFLSAEIEIEFKASLYFYTILFFYFAYRLLSRSLSASIIIIIEMILTAYIMGYIQVFLLGNFDEAEKFTWREAVKIFCCSLIYTSISYLGGWFERSLRITAVYLVFMFACYGCVYWLYCVRRAICTKQMNKELAEFKRQKSEKNQDEF